MSLPAAASASGRSSPVPEACPECDATGSVTSDLHKYQVACTCKPSAQYARAVEPGAPPAKADCPPALPPRPPPSLLQARRNNASPAAAAESQCRRRKYAWWCVGCGALAAALGGLLAAQHILLRAYTASPQHLETVPAAVPAAMLVLTGVCIMSLARRRNRYSYMIKVVGVCCLLCALTCVLVTITTTVIHMNKLQALKFCEYTAVARTCTCYSLPPHAQHTGDDEGVRCVFEGVSECAVVHGALHWCLRGVFALSVAAVLVCICSCMLAYQLLSHERKKMYWEQLELRCRSLYRPRAATRQPPPARPAQGGCNCCAACRPAATAWDVSLQHRFWAPGRIGNLYSPNPGTGRKNSAWSWFPWPRSNSQNSRCRMNGVPQSGDSAYGFCETDTPQPTPQTPYEDRAYPSNYPQPFPRNNTFPQNAQFNAPAQFNQTQGFNAPGQFPAQGFPGQGFQPQTFAQSSGSFAQPTAFTQPPFEEGFGEASGSFDAATGVWGPPPPYSPQGRMGSRHHLHHPDPATATLLHHHHIDHRSSIIHDQNSIQPHTCRNSYMMQNMPGELARELTRLNPELIRLNPEIIRVNPDLGRLNPDVRSDLGRLDPDVMTHMYSQEELSRIQEMGPMDGRFHTLRGHLVPYRCQRNIGMSAGNLHRDCRMEDGMAMECVHQKSASKVSNQSSDSGQKHGKENLAFQSDKNSAVRASMQDCHRGAVAAESEVYFADVSSCCNMSVKADCCVNPNVSALVGTIESHPESTSESDTGSFTLTRQQRPQPQTCSKRRPRQPEKHMSLKHQEKQYQEATNSSLIRLTEQQIEQLNNSMRLRERQDERIEARKHMVDMEPAWEESRMNESRLSDCRKKRPNDSMNESQRLNESKLTDRSTDSRVDSRAEIPRMDRMNETRLSERERMEDRRMSDSNSSIRIHGSPKMRLKMSPIRMKTSPKTFEHPRQPSNDSNKGDFFTPISPLSPKTEESLLSDDDGREDVRYSNEPETSKCIAPDSQYEAARENKEEPLKTNHHHCYSDTNTMDSGWQSGSEKQVTD